MRNYISKLRLLSAAPKVEFNSSTFTSVSPQRSFSDASGALSDSEPPLVDTHGRVHNYLRISLTERCNLRCQYCMPAEGAALSRREALLSRAELARLARVFAALGVRKARLTGGEPTLRPDLVHVVQELRTHFESVSMTTNGLVLTRTLPALQRAGLSALNVSLDSLRPHRYQHMARRPGLPRVLAGIDLALQLGYSPVKVNVVLIKGFNDDEIGDFLELTRDRDIEVRFIEFMPFSGNDWDDSKMVPYRVALRAAAAAAARSGGGGAGAGRDEGELRPLPMKAGDTARRWAVPGHRGTVGFIASMSTPFCGGCNRLRLTADGNLKVCLLGAAEVSLRDAVRGGAGDGALARLVRAALRTKRAQHAAGALWWRRGREWRRAGVRACSTGAGGPLSHLDGRGRARMVDVGSKVPTGRRAEAQCALWVSRRVARLLRPAALPKGDALAVARVAGVLAAKRTPDLIPLCHTVPLHCVRVHIHVPEPDGDGGEADGDGDEAEEERVSVLVRCEVRCEAATGVEMEALTGAAVAALALYDMCKSADRRMRLTDLRLLAKSGGRSDWPRDPSASPDTTPPSPSPDTTPPRSESTPSHDLPQSTKPKDNSTETYAPTNFPYF